MDKPDLKVVEFPKVDLSDIAASLRRLADRVDAGEFPGARAIALVVDGDDVSVIGYGSITPERAIALLAAGQHKMVGMFLTSEIGRLG